MQRVFPSSRLSGFARCERGAIMILFALVLMPMVAMMGFGVDYTRVKLMQVRLQFAIDQAAIGLALYSNPDRYGDDLAQYFGMNFWREDNRDVVLDDLDLDVSEDGRRFDIFARVIVPTLIMDKFGEPFSIVEARAVIGRDRGDLELALVMDNTGSMRGGGKIDAMKDAASELIAILYGDEDQIPGQYISLVPYVATVNIGDDRESWLQNVRPDIWGPTSWKGCVMARQSPHDEDDAPPSSAAFEAFYWETTNWAYANGDNDWIPDRHTRRALGLPVRGWPNEGDVDERNASQNDGYGPNLGCGPAITPLTDSRRVIEDAIDEMEPWHRGGTMANLGLVWGWRTLSPNWRGLWGAPTPSDYPRDYDARHNTKVVILLTDGENSWYDWPNGDPQGDYTGYGRLQEGRLGTTSTSTATRRINERMLRTCTAIKEAGITIYTITFRLNNDTARELYEACASTSSHYFDSPSNEELRENFRQIANRLGIPRILE